MTPPIAPHAAAAGGVVIRGLDAAGDDTMLAKAWLNDAGTVECDNVRFRDTWQQDGIVGRADRGRLFPKDGQAFLDELPFMYKSAYVRAEPMRLFDLMVDEAKQKG